MPYSQWYCFLFVNTLRKILVTIVAGAITFGLTSLLVLPQLPLRDFGACVGLLVLLGPPIAVLVIVPKRWDQMVEAREKARLAAEEEARRIRGRERQAIYEAQRVAEREAELARQAAERHRKQQWDLMNQAAELVEMSAELMQELPEFAQQASRALDHAEEEFTDRVFVPFWEAMGIAVNCLAAFNRNVEAIISNREAYNRLLPSIEERPEQFAVDPSLIPDAAEIATRMSRMARTAHKDADFAHVFGAWKTNELLIAGFSSMQDAMSNLSSNLTTSIRDLKWTLGGKLDEIAMEQREQGRRATESQRQSRATFSLISEAASALDEHHSEERGLLEDIKDQTKRRE
jgi:hypothetical protein